jgi:hypothetical protein
VLFAFVGFLGIAGLILASFFSTSIKEGQQTIRETHLPLFAFVCILPILVIFLAPRFSIEKCLPNSRNAVGRSNPNFRIGCRYRDWTVYLKAQETLNYYRLYPSNTDAQIIPKRCLSRSGEIELLRDFVTSAYRQRQSQVDLNAYSQNFRWA